jgi:type I restriction enzyme S subunit
MKDNSDNGNIPEDWEIVRLGDASINITDGSHFSPKDNKNGEYRIATVANITENYIDIDSCKKISKEDYEMLVKNGCKPKIGDILFSKDGTVGLSFAFKQNEDIVLLSSIAIISPKESLYSDYCAYVLKSPFVFQQIVGSKRGTGLRRIILQDLKRIKIPLPPLPEQRRIAEVLGTVDSAIQSVGGAIESTERLKKGLMQRLLTKGIGHERFKESEVGRVPEGWGVVRLGDESITEIRGNKTVNKFERVAFVPMEFVSDSDIFVKYETRPMKDVKSFTYSERGDLLLAKITPSLENGKQGIIPDSIPNGFALATTEVFPISCKGIDRFFLFYVLKFPKFRNKIISSMIGTTGRQRASKESVEKLQIPLPPLPEQHCIAGILSTVDRKLELERRRKEKLERVKKGLMNELLTGRKRIKVD